MPSAYFVSDIHIMSPSCERARAFLDFLRSLSAAEGTTHLVLLGDIFDLWVADHDYFIKKYGDIIDEIRRLTEEGVEVSYFEGNHDLHLRYFWEVARDGNLTRTAARLNLSQSAVSVQMVQSTVQFARTQVQLNQLQPTKVFVTGGSANMPGLAEYLEGSLHVPVAVFDPLGDAGVEVVGEASTPDLTVALGLAVFLFFSRDLNLLALGDRSAASLGVNTGRVTLVILVTASPDEPIKTDAAGGA